MKFFQLFNSYFLKMVVFYLLTTILYFLIIQFFIVETLRSFNEFSRLIALFCLALITIAAALFIGVNVKINILLLSLLAILPSFLFFSFITNCFFRACLYTQQLSLSQWFITFARSAILMFATTIVFSKLRKIYSQQILIRQIIFFTLSFIFVILGYRILFN